MTQTTRKATLATIAERAQVSKSTVSLALSGGDRIHPDTRQRIVALAEELGYVPPRGRGRDRVLQTVGVLLDRQFSQPGESYFTRIVRGIEEEAELAGSDAVITTVDLGPDESRKMPAFLERNLVSGVIAVGIADTGYLQALESAGKPLVIISGGEEGLSRADYVVNDDFQGMKGVLMHLRALGHRRIAMIGGRLSHLSNLQRYRAFRIYMEELLGGFDPSLVDMGAAEDSIAEGREMAGRLLASGGAFTAIVCMTDDLAFGALDCLKSRGVGVPSQVSVVGYDDFQFAAACDPPLTSIHINCEEMGEVGFQLLQNRLHGGAISHPLRIFVGPELVARRSTGPAPDGLAPR
jgi:LacI family transcriptional regulator